MSNYKLLRKKAFIFISNAILSFTIAAAWPFHINEKGHSHQEGKCSTCVCVTAPQLNSDCGNEIIIKPEGFVYTFKFFSEGIKDKCPISFFFSRSPPYCF